MADVDLMHCFRRALKDWEELRIGEHEESDDDSEAPWDEFYVRWVEDRVASLMRDAEENGVDLPEVNGCEFSPEIALNRAAYIISRGTDVDRETRCMAIMAMQLYDWAIGRQGVRSGKC
jgi:hypothetical protein